MKKKYLYHAISSYQILAAIVHSIIKKRENAVLVLPDFIVNKYPNYNSLVEYGFFQEVYLFPYLTIEHNYDTVYSSVEDAY